MPSVTTFWKTPKSGRQNTTAGNRRIYLLFLPTSTLMLLAVSARRDVSSPDPRVCAPHFYRSAHLQCFIFCVVFQEIMTTKYEMSKLEWSETVSKQLLKWKEEHGAFPPKQEKGLPPETSRQVEGKVTFGVSSCAGDAAQAGSGSTLWGDLHTISVIFPKNLFVHVKAGLHFSFYVSFEGRQV